MARFAVIAEYNNNWIKNSLCIIKSLREFRLILHTLGKYLSPVHMHPDIFLPQLLESALQNGNFWLRYESGIARILKPDIFYPVTSQDRAQFLTVNIQDGAERNVIAFLFPGLQFQVL